MLIYHPACDANHCAYRIISILYGIENNETTFNNIRLCDFYYLFPYLLKKIHPWPNKYNKFRNDVAGLTEQYEEINNPKRVFFELSEVQNNTLIFLMSKEIIDKSKYGDKIIKLNKENLPKSFISHLSNDEFRSTRIFKFLTTSFLSEKLNGKTGIKMRTGLMEYIYD